MVLAWFGSFELVLRIDTRPNRHLRAERCRSRQQHRLPSSDVTIWIVPGRTVRFQLLDLVLVLTSDGQAPVERGGAAMFQSAVPSPPS